MPDDNPEFRLTKKEKQVVIDWINERTKEHRFSCSVCGSSEWVVGDTLVSAPLFHEGMILGGAVYPLTVVICKVCAHTVFLNAMMMGLVKFPPKEGGDEKTGKEEAKKDDGEAQDG